MEGGLMSIYQIQGLQGGVERAFYSDILKSKGSSAFADQIACPPVHTSITLLSLAT